MSDAYLSIHDLQKASATLLSAFSRNVIVEARVHQSNARIQAKGLHSLYFLLRLTSEWRARRCRRQILWDRQCKMRPLLQKFGKDAVPAKALAIARKNSSLLTV